MGTATFVEKKYSVFGNMRIRVGDVTLSASYAAGGDTLSASSLGFNEIIWAAPEGLAATRLDTAYDRANGKILAYFPTGGTSTAPTAIASDPILTAGGTAVTASLATGPFSPGRAKEPAATADLSTLVVRYIFIGY